MGEMHENPAHVRLLEEWMKSYRPAELFDDSGRLRPELAELAPRGNRRMSANPHTNGGLLLRELRLPNFRDYAVDVTAPGAVMAESDAGHGPVPPRRHEAKHGGTEFPPFQSGREQLEPAGRTCLRSPIVPGSRKPIPGMITSRPTGGSWRCSASTNAKAGSRAIS